MDTHTNIHIITINKNISKEATNLKRAGSGVWESVAGGKVREKCVIKLQSQKFDLFRTLSDN